MSLTVRPKSQSHDPKGMARKCHEPARSYDVGEYLWSISSKVNGPEHQDIEGMYQFQIEQATAQLGFDRIEAHFNEELLNWKPHPKTFEPVFTTSRI